MNKILFFYYKETDKEHIEILENVLSDHTLTTTNSLTQAQKLLEESEYDLILVDFTKEEGKEFLSYISQHIPEQKIITMSDNIECSALQGCEYCMETLKRKRVFKPLNLKELVHTIKNYEDMVCHYMHKFHNIIHILEEIIHAKYNHFVYDKINQLIHPKEKYAESLIVEELIHITELLQLNEIDYSVNENYTIKLLPKE